jgi:queuine tRNA-ribosyltransferase
MAGEINSSMLNTYHNVYYYLNLMKEIREQIAADTFSNFAAERLRVRGEL